MKKQILIVGLLMISAITFGQKKEIKTALKSIKSGNYSAAIRTLQQAEGMLSNADSALKEHYYLAKGQAYIGDAGNDYEKLVIAADSFEKVLALNPKSKYKSETLQGLEEVRAGLVNGAIEDQNSKRNSLASKKLYRAYNLSKKDTSYLYYAASNAVNSKDYNDAITYYTELLDIGYTGIEKQYFATNIETKVEEKFNSEKERNLVLKSGKYAIPKEKISESSRGEILRNMTLIYIRQGKTEEAQELMTKARSENPDDITLMEAEARMYYNSGDMVSYKKIINEMITKNPNNSELYYNLGVVSNNNGKPEEALKYYAKALELNPDYAEALINKAQIILNKESKIVDEMNALGTSTADYNRYDELKEVKSNLYKDAIPYLERASVLRPKNIELLKTLKNIYSTLGNDNKAKEMKAKLEVIENN